jgi:starvation-inducible DNA-binding protein
MVHKIEADFSEQKINIGIDQKERKELCKALGTFLADTYLLYLKTQNYHWNVTGKMFQPLHSLFEEQYQDMARAIDKIAERIRALGEYAPGSFSSFSRLSTLKEENSIPSSDEMIHYLITGHEHIITNAREMLSICESCEDEVSADLLVQRMQIHEKNAWILRSLLTAQKNH